MFLYLGLKSLANFVGLYGFLASVFIVRPLDPCSIFPYKSLVSYPLESLLLSNLLRKFSFPCPPSIKNSPKDYKSILIDQKTHVTPLRPHYCSNGLWFSPNWLLIASLPQMIPNFPMAIKTFQSFFHPSVISTHSSSIYWADDPPFLNLQRRWWSLEMIP